VHVLLLVALALAQVPDAGPPPDPLREPLALFAHRLDPASLDAAIRELESMHWHQALLLDARAHRFRARAFELRRRPIVRAAGVADLEAAHALASQAWQQCAPGAPARAESGELGLALAQSRGDCVPALMALAEADVQLAEWRRPIEAVPLLREALALSQRAEQFDPDFEFAAPRRVAAEVLAVLPATAGGNLRASRFEFERAIASAPGVLANRVAMAARFAVQTQDRRLFRALLQSALELDPRAIPERTPEQLLDRAVALGLLHREAELFRG
jgi:hypothetical protein